MTIEFDQPAFTLNHSFSFYDCEIALSSTAGPSVYLETKQLIRFEKCNLKANICIWGHRGGASYEPLDQIGPSVFFDNCRGEMFQVQVLDGPVATMKPKVQISGFVDHVRINPQDEWPFELQVSQIRFTTLEIVGSFTGMQLTAYTGKEIFFRNFSFQSFWMRENIGLIPFVSIDERSIENISIKIRTIGYEIHEIVQTIEMILDVLHRTKQGTSFLLINEALCTYIFRTQIKKPIKNFRNLVIYGFFRNFYAMWPWVLVSILIIFGFSVLYKALGAEEFSKAFQNSVFAFSGNPSNISDRPFLYNSFGALEAYVGILVVIIASLVLSRKYSAHR